MSVRGFLPSTAHADRNRRAAFFESILKHSHDAPTIALVHQEVNMERLRDKCNKLAPGAEAVVNALLGRVLLAFAPTEFLQQVRSGI